MVTGLRFPFQLEFPKSKNYRPSYGQIIHLRFWGNFDSISFKTPTFPLYKSPQLRITNQITITKNTNHNELIFKGVLYLFLGHLKLYSPFLLHFSSCSFATNLGILEAKWWRTNPSKDRFFFFYLFFLFLFSLFSFSSSPTGYTQENKA